MYENYRKLGPYIRKDNRKIILIEINKNWKTVSYPKYLMEEYLKRFLLKDETVDHINADFTDNRIENLQILSRAENSAKSHKDGTAHSGSLNLNEAQRNTRSNRIKGEKNPSSKFDEKTVLELRLKFKNKEISVRDIMEKYHVNEKTTRSMLKGKTYCDVPGALPTKETREIKIKKVKALRSEGFSLRQIAEITKISLSAIQVYIKDNFYRVGSTPTCSTIYIGES